MPISGLPYIFTLYNAVNHPLQCVVGGPLSLWALILQSTPAPPKEGKTAHRHLAHTQPASVTNTKMIMAFWNESLCFYLCREGSSSEVPILVVGNKRDLQRQRFMPRRAVSVLVKKTWKCGYVECSAKFNWHVVLLFKELLGIAVARGMRQNHTSIRLQGALQRNRCTIMWQWEFPPPLLPRSGEAVKKRTFYLNGWKYTLWPPALLSWFFLMRFISLVRCKRHSDFTHGHPNTVDAKKEVEEEAGENQKY